MNDDPCENKHGGTATSVEAWQRSLRDAPQIKRDLMAMARLAGERGITLKEACAKLGKNPNAISGRFTELGFTGQLRRSQARRDGCYVWVEGSANAGH